MVSGLDGITEITENVENEVIDFKRSTGECWCLHISEGAVAIRIDGTCLCDILCCWRGEINRHKQPRKCMLLSRVIFKAYATGRRVKASLELEPLTPLLRALKYFLIWNWKRCCFFYFLIIIILFKISFKNRGFLLLFEQLSPITADSSDVRLMLSLCFLLPSSWYSGAPTFSACFRTINMIDPFF